MLIALLTALSVVIRKIIYAVAEIYKKRKRTLSFVFCFFAVSLAFAFSINRFVEAEGIDRTLKVNADGKIYEYSYPQIRVYRGEYVFLGLQAEVDRIYLDTLKKPINAELSFSPDFKEWFYIYNEQSGRAIDKKVSFALIEQALLSGDGEVNLPIIDLYPDIYAKELKRKTFMRSVFSTNCEYSSAERKHNISLACEKLKAVIVKDGESFSFNETVGKRSAENGYKSAKIISEGKFVEGVGGGVCQVSSTLYNAALTAGLKIKEVHRHTLKVSYVEPSFDAMVSSVSDLKFENKTGNDVYISAAFDGKKITVCIFGLMRNFEYRRVSVIKEIVEAKDKEVLDETLLGGERITVSNKIDGLKSEGYIELYKNGVLEGRIKVREDYYLPVDGEVRVGADKQSGAETFLFFAP